MGSHFGRMPGNEKVVVTEAGLRLNANSLSPWLRRSGPSDLEGTSGMQITLGPIIPGEGGRMTRSGRIVLPSGRVLLVVFQALRDGFRSRVRWFAKCGSCGGRCAVLYLERGHVPLCSHCARIAWVGERIPPGRRAAVRALRDCYGLSLDPEDVRAEWQKRKAQAQRVARRNRPQRSPGGTIP